MHSQFNDTLVSVKLSRAICEERETPASLIIIGLALRLPKLPDQLDVQVMVGRGVKAELLLNKIDPTFLSCETKVYITKILHIAASCKIARNFKELITCNFCYTMIIW